MKKILFCLLAIVLVSLNSYSQQDKRPANYDIRIDTEMVHDYGDGCYEIQVRVVYFFSDTYTFVAAYANVMVGNCPTGRFVSQHQNANCDDIEYKGEFIINSKNSNEKCFIDYLKDEAIYMKYTAAKEKLISSVHK